ncbi:hypothetical protein DAPPUDRAFT_126002, partial [Daphnia pulex]
MVSAAPSAAPMKGAVHGEATPTASTPVRPWSSKGLRARMVAIPLGMKEPNSNTPIRFKAISVNRMASTVTTSGDCSWKPQPSASPPARSASSRPANPTKEATTPAGIRFRSRPPPKANASATNNPVPPASPGSGDAATLAATACSPGAGQPDTAKLMAIPAWSPGRARTAFMNSGLSLRCADRGMRSTRSFPRRDAEMVPAGSTTAGSSGKNSKASPVHADGSPRTVTASTAPSMAPCACTPASAFGWAANALSNSAASDVDAAFAGTISSNSPVCGMHSCLHTSQSAWSFTRSACPENPSAM